MWMYFLLSLICTAVGMQFFITKISNTRLFQRKESVESIKKSCIKELHQSKSHTPSMGGVVMNAILLICTGVYYLNTRQILWTNFFIILFGIMGFIDDYIKIKKVRDGVSPNEKLLGLTSISILIVSYLLLAGIVKPEIIIPLINHPYVLHPLLFAGIMVLLIVSTTNSMNLTDGLDGLALGISVIVLAFISIMAWRMANNEVLLNAMILEGVCLGMLLYNKYPAKVFMGDTGSLFLGGAIAILMIQLQIPLWLMVMLIVCYGETVSVILQLSSLKLRNKQIFKIAPFHHHLEKCGWKETKVVYTFWVVTFIFCLLGYILVLGGMA